MLALTLMLHQAAHPKKHLQVLQPEAINQNIQELPSSWAEAFFYP
jgi:hypothetical protein